MWINGDIRELFTEGHFLQERLPTRTSLDNYEDISSKFCKLMYKGKTKSALNYLSRNTTGGILNPQDVIQLTPESDPISVLEILEKQHPSSSDPNPEILLQHDTFCLPFNNIIFYNLDGDSIKQAEIRCQGAAGPSGLDFTAWRQMCCSFQHASRDLCNALAIIGCQICTQSISCSCVSLGGLLPHCLE